MQIEYSSNFVKVVIRMVAASVGGSPSTKFTFKGMTPPTIFTWLYRPMNALQLCRWQFSHKESLQQTFFKWNVVLDGKRPFCIRFSDAVKILGITLDNTVIFLPHVDGAVRSCYFHRHTCSPTRMHAHCIICILTRHAIH